MMDFRFSLMFAFAFVLLCGTRAQAIEIDKRSAAALNQVVLYEDSTFIHHSNHTYREGALFRVLDETTKQHPDADQKQKFKWYKVETPDKRTGWIFGDGLAVYVEKNDVEPVLLPLHRKQIDLGQGFENSLMWIASIQGRDNFHAHDYMNPLYNEYYLVITNARGKSILLRCAGESARGETDIKDVQTRDLTGDAVPEIIIQRSTLNVGSHLDQREIEIFSLKAGTFSSVFRQHFTLAYDNEFPSPSLYKYIDIEDKGIRISYVDYVPCSKYAHHEADPRFKRRERCMEYVTDYLSWDARKKEFSSAYGETRMDISGGVYESTPLKPEPERGSKTLTYIPNTERITIIKHYEEYVLEHGKKKIRNWFFVKTTNGKTGYIQAENAGLIEVEHADILNRYYANPPLSKTTWKMDGAEFVRYWLP